MSLDTKINKLFKKAKNTEDDSKMGAFFKLKHEMNTKLYKSYLETLPVFKETKKNLLNGIKENDIPVELQKFAPFKNTYKNNLLSRLGLLSYQFDRNFMEEHDIKLDEVSRCKLFRDVFKEKYNINAINLSCEKLVDEECDHGVWLVARKNK